jgi:hypothetical protein
MKSTSSSSNNGTPWCTNNGRVFEGLHMGSLLWVGWMNDSCLALHWYNFENRFKLGLSGDSESQRSHSWQKKKPGNCLWRPFPKWEQKTPPQTSKLLLLIDWWSWHGVLQVRGCWLHCWHIKPGHGPWHWRCLFFLPSLHFSACCISSSSSLVLCLCLEINFLERVVIRMREAPTTTGNKTRNTILAVTRSCYCCWGTTMSED